MNIGVICELYHPYVAGHQARMQRFLHAFVQRGHQVNLYTIDHIGNLPDHEVIHGVQVHRVTHDARYYKTGRFGRRLPTLFRYAADLIPHINKAKHESLIFTQFSLIPAIFARFYNIKNTPTVLDFVEWRSTRLWYSLHRLLFAAAQNIVCNTSAIREKVAAFTQRPDATHYIPSPIHLNHYQPGTPQHVLYIGRMEPHKHPESAIELVLDYNSKMPLNKQHLHMVGDGRMLNKLKTQYVDQFVTFHGFVSDAQKYELLKNAKALIIPSEREGLPEVVIEAVATGVPILTTDYPDNGTKDFVRSENVGLVSKPDTASLTTALDDVLRNRAQYAALCKTARNQFSELVTVDQYLRIAAKSPHKP